MKKKLIVFLIIPIFSFGQGDYKNASELLKSGILKVNSENYDGALKDFNLAIERDTKGEILDTIYFQRAQLKRRKFKDFNGALKDYNTSLKYNKNYVPSYMYRGLLNRRIFKNYEAAEKDYRTSIEIDPNCGSCAMELGYFSRRIKDDERIKYLEKAIELKMDLNFDRNLTPCFSCYGAIGWIKYRQGDYLEAIKYHQLLIDNYQEIDVNGDGKVDETGYLNYAYFSKARTYFYGLNQNDKAIEEINKAIEIEPNIKSYYTLRSEIRYDDQNFEESLKDYQKAKSIKEKTYYNDVYIAEDYYPYIKLDRNLDTLDLPVQVHTKIDIYDILGLETTNDQFFMDIHYNVYSNVYPKLLNYKNDTLDFFDFAKYPRIKPIYVGSDRLKITDLKNEGLDDIDITNEIIYSGQIQTDFFYDWNLKDYPFDVQELKFEIQADIDTSFVRLSQSNFYKSTFQNVKGLKEGYRIEEIKFEEKFMERPQEETFYPSLAIRNVVNSVASYKIIISRSGGWLFVKLFLGSFLAFLISWIVFLIPNKEFDSRISLTVGGIFGAIGNRYFVDSTIPAVQVLTKADMINNMILALLILNVFIVIVQKNDKINLGILEKNKFAMIFTGIAFVILNTLIVVW